MSIVIGRGRYARETYPRSPTPIGALLPVGSPGTVLGWDVASEAWVPTQPMPVVELAGPTHIAVADHNGRYVAISNALACTYDVPLGILPVGAAICGEQTGLGQLEIMASDVGVTIEPALGKTAFVRAPGSVWGLIQVTLNFWRLFGDLQDA